MQVMRRGGPDALEVTEQELREPHANEVRVLVQAASVSQVDVQARYGLGPFRQRPPFVPGYAVVGVVDAVGDTVTGLAVGDRVGVLTETGGYSEYVYVRRHPVVRVPLAVDSTQAVVVMLNYLVAYQVLHRRANVRAGDRVLITGAGGGIGTALCELGRDAGLRMYGVESVTKHHVLVGYGVTPIDSSTQDVEEVVRRAEPQGLDAVLDAVGGGYVTTGLAVLRPGGVLVEFANPGGKMALLRLLARGVVVRLTGDGRAITSYGTNVWRYGRGPFLHDWRVLFQLLEQGRISPIVAATFPLLEAAAANELLERHAVTGTIVLRNDPDDEGPGHRR